jgi:hypothetical protein
MPRNRTDCLVWLGLLFVAAPLAGCSPPPADEPPTPHEVHKRLAQDLAKREEHLLLEDLHDDGDGRYSGTAKGNSGGVVYTYRIEAKVEARWLHYTARGSTLMGEGPVLSGVIPLPVPSFRERHAELMQWLRAVAFVVQGLAVVWAVLGRFGYRRLYSPRVERVVILSAAINLGFVLLWGYEFYMNLGAD